MAGGKALKEAGLVFDVAHTSLLTRAQVGLPQRGGVRLSEKEDQSTGTYYR